MFRCSLARVCPRRRISPPWTGTPRTCQASPSSFLSSSSPARKSEHSMASHTPQDAHKDTRLRDVRLSKLFLAPSARGIAAGSASKEDPHALLVRAGYIRQAHAGVFHLLPLALRVQRRIEAGLQTVMAKIDATEVSLSSISSEALWRRSGRIEKSLENGQHEFMTVQDRKKSGFILSPTHEEEITNLVADMTNSYKDFPLRLYQISRKYRDELRPRQGLLRTKEFLMKDLYTFDTSEKAALDTYQSVRSAYRSFFEALGVPYVEVEASSGNMGGSLSHEYHFLSPLGEDTIVICESCGFAANEEILEKKAEAQDNHQCPRCTSHKVSSHRAIEVGHTFHLGTRYTEPLNAFVNVPRTVELKENTAGQADGQGVVPSAQDSNITRMPLHMGCHGIGVSRLIGAVAAMTADEKGLAWPVVMAPAHAIVVFDGMTPPADPKDPTTTNDYSELVNKIGGIYYNGDWGRTQGLDLVFDDRDRPLPWKLKDADLVGYPIIVVLGKSYKETGKYEIQCRTSSRLSATSQFLTTSVGTILGDLTAATQEKGAWQLGISGKRLTPAEKAFWRDRNNPQVVPKMDQNDPQAPKVSIQNARNVGPTSALAKPLEHATNNNELDLAKPSSSADSVVRRVIPLCRICRQNHTGLCPLLPPKCPICLRKHRGACKRSANPVENTNYFSDSPNWEIQESRPQEPRPVQHKISSPPQPPTLSHEHLLERVTLLERLMALKAEEDMLKKQSGND